MAPSASSPSRELFGILGSIPDISRVLSEWNKRFMKNAVDASLTRYPTSEENLPERLSEMFHFDRRGYIIGEKLQESIIPLLDHIDKSVGDRVNTVVNRGGVLIGYFCGSDDKERLKLWNCM